MRLSASNKGHAGVQADAAMPPALAAYLESLPPASRNSSREIVRSLWNRASAMAKRSRGHALAAKRMLNDRLGVELDFDVDYDPARDHREPRSIFETTELPF